MFKGEGKRKLKCPCYTGIQLGQREEVRHMHKFWASWLEVITSLVKVHSE